MDAVPYNQSLGSGKKHKAPQQPKLLNLRNKEGGILVQGKAMTRGSCAC